MSAKSFSSSRRNEPPFFPPLLYSQDDDSLHATLHLHEQDRVDRLQKMLTIPEEALVAFAETDAPITRTDSERFAQQHLLDLDLYCHEGVGPVRAVYFRELVLGQQYGTLMHSTRWAGSSYFHACRLRRDRLEWLVHDSLLETLLASLGVTWTQIETALFDAFCSCLPAPFRARYEQGQENRTALPAQALVDPSLISRTLG